MKIKTLLTSLLIFMAITTYAQSSNAISEAAKAKTEQLQQALNLNTDQNQRVYRQFYTYESQLQKYNKIEAKTSTQKSTMVQYTERFDKAMKDILNADQYTEFSKMMKKDKKYFIQ